MVKGRGKSKRKTYRTRGKTYKVRSKVSRKSYSKSYRKSTKKRKNKRRGSKKRKLYGGIKGILKKKRNEVQNLEELINANPPTGEEMENATLKSDYQNMVREHQKLILNAEILEYMNDGKTMEEYITYVRGGVGDGSSVDITVTCPDGATAGDSILVEAGESEIEVTIPEGVEPGEEFDVEFSAGDKSDKIEEQWTLVEADIRGRLYSIGELLGYRIDAFERVPIQELIRIMKNLEKAVVLFTAAE